MPPTNGGKRKRGDRSWSGDSTNDGQRPSPHRPGNLNLAQQNQPQSPSQNRDSGDTRGRGGRRASRGGRGQPGRIPTHAQSPSNQSQDIAMSPPSAKPTNPAAEVRQANGVSTSSSTAAPSQSHIKSSETTQIDQQESFRHYEYLTQDVLSGWPSGGKQKVIDSGIAARSDEDFLVLAKLFQEIINVVLLGRISPSEAGDAVKQIVGDGITSEDEEAAHAFKPSEGQFDARSLFLDTVSVLVDEKDATNSALQHFIFATAISPALLRFELDTTLIQGLGLVRDTFSRMGIRKQTNILYRQSNYNLLREESEGYSKLVTELFTTSNSESPSSEIVEDTFERVKAMIGAFDLDVGRVLDVTLDVFAAVLVKKYHFFVRFLRASSWWPKTDPMHSEEENDPSSGLPSWAIPGWVSFDEERKEELVRLQDERDRKFWDRVREVGIRGFFEIGRRPLNDEERRNAATDANVQSDTEDETRKWIEQTGTLPPKGNRVAAQLLGFKLRFYSASARDAGVLPENLIWVAALLIKIGFISLRDLYPHLWRPDDSMQELEEKLRKEKLEREVKARPGGGVNALMMAGALSDDTLPPTGRPRDSDTTPSKEQETDKAKDDEMEPTPEIREQKVLLLKSLLTIGAIPEALFIISRFPWLIDLCPELPDYIHRILHHCLSKLHAPLRPLQDTDQLVEPKQITSADQSGVPKGQVRLADAPPRKLLRWAHPDKEDHEEGTNYRFYWDHWAENIPVCQTVDDFFALASSFLNISGYKIGQDPTLLAKILRIGKDSLNKDASQANTTRWQDLCKRLLLPSLSLTKINPGVANEMFDLLRHFPRAVRYNMYAEWHFGQTAKHPDIESAFALARAETRDTLKRLSKTNVKPMARALANIAYANPGIVINVEISQIESYDNLIEVVVECCRYFTDLGYDILTWALVNSLGQQGRSRVQESGLLRSRWLNALSTFTGKAFKRYSVLNPTPVLQYVFEQLRQSNSTDLIILEQMISSMAGIVTDTNFNDAQIQAMTGGSLLQSQTMLQLLDKRHESKTTSKRLMKSLTDSKLAGQLLIAIAQERLVCVFRESEMNPELKLLGNIFDEVHRILTQYLDLLRSNFTVAEFDTFVPSLSSLIGEFGIQPDIAFWIVRPSLCQQIAETDLTTKGDSTVSKEDADEATMKQIANGEVEMSDANGTVGKAEGAPLDEEMEVDQPPGDTEAISRQAVSSNIALASSDATTWHPILQDLMREMRAVLRPETWEIIGLPFYVTFWQLSLYDVHIPQKAYEDEIERQKRKVSTISNDRTDVSITGTQRKEKEKKQIQELQDRLLEENKQHLTSYGRTRTRLQKEKDQWFAGMRGRHDILNISLLEQCFLPRLLLSPIDAFFSFKILKFLHTSGAPNFRTVGLLDQLFREQRLTAIIFQCTSKEADNFGRFLNEILRDLTRWHADKVVYDKEAFGTKRDLPGFAINVDAEGKPAAFLDYEDFRRLFYKWHRLLAGSLKNCFNGGEYMHIRNAISILKAVVQYFPAVNWIGRDMLACVNSLSQNDDRSDVKTPAASLIGDLNRREKKWMLPQAFMINENLAGEKGKPHPSRPQSTTPKPLNATAAEFQPPSSATTNGTSDHQPKGKEVEDGEIEDAKMNDVGASIELEKPPEDNSTVDADQTQSTAEASVAVKNEVSSSKEAAAHGSEAERPPSSASQKLSETDGARTSSPSLSRQGSRPPDSNLSADISKRPDPDRVSTHPSRLPLNLPNKPEPRGYRHDGRTLRQPEVMDDRRDSRDGRHSGFPRSGRYSDSERDRPFDHDTRGHGRLDRDRGELLPPRAPPPFDDQFRGPRDGRVAPRDTDTARSGRERPSAEVFPRDGAVSGRPVPQPHPERADLIQEHPDRAALIEGVDYRRGDPPRSERDDRRPQSSRVTSPSRTDPRQDRFSSDDRRPHGRHDDFPSGPRGERPGRPDLMETRDPWPGPDMSHGRLNQDSRFPRGTDSPTDIPSGPRSRNAPGRGRIVSSSQPATPGTPSAVQERQPPTGPSGRSNARVGGYDAPPAPSPVSEKADAPGVHPDRLKNLQVAGEPSGVNTRPPAPIAPPLGPRNSQGPPSGPGGDRGRGDKRFAGLNNMLQQYGGSQDRSGQGTLIRGRGRQVNAMNTGSPHGSRTSSPPGGPEGPGHIRPELFPGDDDNRSSGRGRRNDAADDAPEPQRSGRDANNTPDRDRERDQEREMNRRGPDENARGGGHRDDRRDRVRDRERSHRNDNENREEPINPEVAEPSGRRGPSNRDETRRRDRRDRDDGPTDQLGPSNNELHGRLRPPSSQGTPLAPPGGPADDRRWSGGGGYRDRDRRGGGGGGGGGRDYNRDSAAGGSGNITLPRKRGRPGDDSHGPGDGGGRGGGMRVGSESKRPRRGA